MRTGALLEGRAVATANQTFNTSAAEKDVRLPVLPDFGGKRQMRVTRYSQWLSLLHRLFAVDPRSLALLRVSLGVCVLGDLWLNRAFELHHYTDEFVSRGYFLNSYLKGGQLSVYMIGGSLTWVLIAFGLVMVFSASAVIAMERSGDEAYYLKRQLMALGAGTVLCAVTAITPTRVIRRYRTVLYTMTIIGLLLCFVPGIQHRANGAARWLGFGSVHVQPSEFAKLVVLISLAHYLDRWRGQLPDWRVLLRAALIPLPVMMLVLPEPDFGTTAIIGGICALMLFVA